MKKFILFVILFFNLMPVSKKGKIIIAGPTATIAQDQNSGGEEYYDEENTENENYVIDQFEGVSHTLDQVTVTDFVHYMEDELGYSDLSLLDLPTLSTFFNDYINSLDPDSGSGSGSGPGSGPGSGSGSSNCVTMDKNYLNELYYNFDNYNSSFGNDIVYYVYNRIIGGLSPQLTTPILVSSNPPSGVTLSADGHYIDQGGQASSMTSTDGTNIYISPYTINLGINYVIAQLSHELVHAIIDQNHFNFTEEQQEALADTYQSLTWDALGNHANAQIYENASANLVPIPNSAMQNFPLPSSIKPPCP